MYKNVIFQSYAIGIYTHGKSLAFIFLSQLFKLRTQLQLCSNSFKTAKTAKSVILLCGGKQVVPLVTSSALADAE